MSKHIPTIVAATISFMVGAGAVSAFAVQTNYLGVMFVADTTIPTRQMTVNADGSVNVALR